MARIAPPVVVHRLRRLHAAARVALALDVLLIAQEELALAVERVDVEEPGAGVERGRPPVGRAAGGRRHHRSLGRGEHAGHPDRTAVLVEPFRPGLQRERLAEQELAGLAVERVVEAVAVGPQHRPARPVRHLDIGEHRDLDRVPVMHVVRRELEIPPHLARVAIEGQDRVGVQVVAQPHLAAVVGAGVAGAPVDEVQLRIVRAGDPGRRPARAPRISQPCLVVGMVRTRNGVGPPGALAGLGVVRIEEPRGCRTPRRRCPSPPGP